MFFTGEKACSTQGKLVLFFFTEGLMQTALCNPAVPVKIVIWSYSRYNLIVLTRRQPLYEMLVCALGNEGAISVVKWVLGLM